MVPDYRYRSRLNSGKIHKRQRNHLGIVVSSADLNVKGLTFEAYKRTNALTFNVNYFQGLDFSFKTRAKAEASFNAKGQRLTSVAAGISSKTENTP